MTFTYKKLMLVQICILALLSGCAGSPETIDNTLADEFSDDSMDVLFATEFPVASEEDALFQVDLAVREGDTDQALFYLVRALQFRTDNVDVLLRIGDIQMQRHEVVFATRAYLTANYHDPENSKALEGLGLIYLAAGDDEEAIVHLPKLPTFHKDPFDRMLICQAIQHELTILTPDPLITQYAIRTIW